VRSDYGSTWGAYLCEEENSVDVLYLGSSYAYCDWNPGVIYDETGLTGYVMGGSEQTLSQTYWYLKEALKTQQPAAVVLEGTALLFEEYQNYTKINVGYMPWGTNRLGAIFTASEEELRTGLLCDLYFYHDRWKELSGETVRAALARPQRDHLKGYTALTSTQSQSDGPYLNPMGIAETVYEDNLADLGRIAALCEEEGIALTVLFNPKYSQFYPAVYEQLETDVTLAAPQADFVNWADSFEEIGIDTQRHFFDAGHLNEEGAALLSRHLGRYLIGQGVAPRAQTEENAAAWAETAAHWCGEGA